MKIPYSKDYEPPAPVLPVRLGSPSGGAGVQMTALLGTGADMTVMPAAVVKNLSLPIVATTRVVGVGGETHARIHAGLLEVAGETRIVELVALGGEAILGRDVINEWLIALDGPRRVLEIRGSRGRARRC